MDGRRSDERSLAMGKKSTDADSMLDIVQHAQFSDAGRPLTKSEHILEQSDASSANPELHDDPPASTVKSNPPFARWKPFTSFLPRSICRIPKEQLKIIESEDGWRPAKVGRRPLEQNIPEVIWDQLVAAARGTSLVEQSLASSERDRDQGHVSSTALQTAQPVAMSAVSEASDEDSSQAVPWSQTQQVQRPVSPVEAQRLPKSPTTAVGSQKVPWSPSQQLCSPPSPVGSDVSWDGSEASEDEIAHCSGLIDSEDVLGMDGLPMDSPPMRPKSFLKSRECESVDDHLVAEDSKLAPATSHASTQQKHSPDSVQDLTDPNSSETIKARDLGTYDTEPAQIVFSTSAHESEQSSSLRLCSSTIGEVQGERTPFPMKVDGQSESTPSSTALSCIPASFQPRVMMQRNRETHPPITLKLEQTESSFEDNSSEDGELSQDVDQPHHATPINAHQDISLSPLKTLETAMLSNRNQFKALVETEGDLNNNRLSARGEQAVESRSDRSEVTRLKRSSPANVDSSTRKRLRLMAPPAIPPRHSDRDELTVNKKARQFRRELINMVKTRRNEVDDIETSSPVLGADAGRESSEVFSQDGLDSIASHKQSHSTPITERSALFLVPEKGRATTTSVRTTRTTSNDSKDIYHTYKAAYPGYCGDSVQFENACQLIRTLRQAGKAPHPSLWDDFIYRLVHDYKQYVNDAIVAGRSIEPYPLFYEEYVEEPIYFKRIVRPADIDDSERNDDTTRLLEARSLDRDRSASASVQLRSGSLQSRNRASIRLEHDGSGDHVDNKHVANAEGPEILETQRIRAEPVDRSQDSSVRIWLEKAPGAESPDLGTPLEQSSLMEVDELQLDEQAVSPSPNPLPTASKEKAGQSSTPASSQVRRAETSVATTQNSDSAVRHVDTVCSSPLFPIEPSQPTLGISASMPAEVTSTKHPMPRPQITPTTNIFSDPGPRLTSNKSSPHISSKPAPIPSPQPTRKASKVLSAFDKFLTNYRKLPGETQASTAHSVKHGHRTIDVFSWRDS